MSDTPTPKESSAVETTKRHDHRQSVWLVGDVLWCYQCGAWRQAGEGRHRWHKPTGVGGPNPCSTGTNMEGAMSDIERFVTIWGGVVMNPASSGNWVRYDDHRAEVERVKNNLFPWDTYDRLKNANEHLKEDVAKLTAERDEAQAEVERLRANGQAILDSSRPDDETIWREAFMAAIQGGRVYDRMTVADLALADYRKRWPR